MRTSIMLLFVLGFAAPLSAQESTIPGPAIVAIVDLARVSDESLVGQDLARQLGELQGNLQDTLEDRRARVAQSQAEFQSMVDAFQADRDTLAEADVRTRENELMDRQQALQDLMQAVQVDADGAQRRLQGEVARLTAQLDADIRPHIEAVAREMGVDVLLPASQTVFANPALDITDQVIARVDAAFNQG